jgi:hypothetical protein
MKMFFPLLLAFWIVGVSTYTAAADDPVDLRDKQGVVDPQDLKKDDPKPPKIEKESPPPPETKENDENYTVHTTGEGHGGVPTSGGFKP